VTVPSLELSGTACLFRQVDGAELLHITQLSFQESSGIFIPDRRSPEIIGPLR
jgi:hypothetical protein